jgi:acyl-CoA synthetase (AMP-forming)/AMP-acid ligase II
MPPPPRIVDIVGAVAARAPDRAAIVADGEVVSYAALLRRIEQVAGALAGLGLRPGQTVAVGVGDPLLHLLLLAAFEQRGVVTGSFRTDEGEGCHDLLAAVDTVLTDTAESPAPCRRHVVLGPDWMARAAQGPPPAEAIAPVDAPMMIIRSSGTTGRPKRMLLTRAMLAARRDQRVAAYGMTASTRYLLTVAPNVHSVVVGITLTWQLGGLVVTERRLPLWLAFAACQPSHATILPRQLAELLAALPADFARLPGLTLIVMGGRLPAALRAAALARFAGGIVDHYGANEAGLICRLEADGTGALAPGMTAAIVDAAGAPVGAGLPGFVAVRGAAVAAGYLDAPALTARHFRDGWFLTDDLAVALGDHRLRLFGRAGEVLNIGGHKLACAEVEAVLLAESGLADAAVAQDGLDAAVTVACVLAPAQTLAQAEARIRACLPALLADARLVAVAAIPRTPTGKPRRPALAALLAAAA